MTTKLTCEGEGYQGAKCLAEATNNVGGIDFCVQHAREYVRECELEWAGSIREAGLEGWPGR